jgi:uncharacterized membrane protein YccF (DUF307 family)
MRLILNVIWFVFAGLWRTGARSRLGNPLVPSPR